MPASPVRQADFARSSSIKADLRMAVMGESDLDRLADLFAAFLDERDVPGYACAAVADGGLVPLFGDRPDLVGAPDAIAITVDQAAGGPCVMLLSPRVAALDEPVRAMVRGYAVMVAARGGLLAIKRRTTETSCPLSLEQRAILARRLCGVADLDIAGELRLPVVLIAELAEDARVRLGARDRAETVAIAARRGWLIVPSQQFYTLSDENIA